MTHVRVIDEPEATGELREAYAEIRAKRGSVGNILKAESLAPAIMRRHLDLYVELLFGKGPLSRREREMVAVVVSVANRCDYCLVHHADALGRYVTEPGLVPLLVSDPQKAPLAPRERALVEAALKLTREPGAWQAADAEALRKAGFGDEEILALVEVTAYFNYANRVANGLGVTPEDAPKTYNY